MGNVKRKRVTSKAGAAVHPGAVLLADFIERRGITRYRVAKAMGIKQQRIDEICAGVRAVSPETAVRLGLVFGDDPIGRDPRYWLDLQAQHDIAVVHREQGKRLAEEVTPLDHEAVGGRSAKQR